MIRYFLAFLLSVILHGFFLPGGCPAFTGSPKLYFFNPDSARSNLGRLKFEMETFFDHSGYPVSFQAFSHQTDFDTQISRQHPKFLFAPQWYIQEHGRRLKFRPFLVPVYKGATTYRKVLLAAKDSRITLDSIKNHSLAMTSVGPDSETVLNRMLFWHRCKKTCTVHPVIVPKSTDALFALFLGQVDLALVVENHLENLKKTLPRIVGGVRPLILSNPVPMPMLCYSEKRATQGEIQKLKTIFLAEENKRIRNTLLESLQIDEWQEIPK